MRTSRALLATALASAAAVWAAGCGDNSARCGTGTTNVNGYCIPDSTVMCGQGTVLDAQSGDCVPDPSACAPGTVLVNGQCIPDDDNLHADLEEGPEPNDGMASGDGVAGQFNVPPVGQSISMHGCVNPYRDLDGNGNPDIDYDEWVVSITQPTLLEITADGVHGLSAGYVVLPISEADLTGAGFRRFGINLAGDTSKRQVYLPEAGTYAIVMTDSRSLFLQDGAAGSPTACYYTTVKNVALPTPTPATVNTTITGQHAGDAKFYSVTPQEGGLIDAVNSIAIAAASPSIVVVKNNTFAAYGAPGFFNPAAEAIAGGLRASDSILVVVDPEYNYALAPVDYTLTLNAPTVFALPTDGSTVTVTNVSGTFNTINDLLWGYFDVQANQVVHFDLQFQDPGSELVFATSDLLVVSDVTGLLAGLPTPQPITSFDGWVRFPAAGRYYAVLLQDGAAASSTMDVTGTVKQVTPQPIAIGTPIDNHAFSDLGATWHTLDTSSAIWLSSSASASGFGSDVVLDRYSATAVGVVDVDFQPLATETFANDGSDVHNRIVFNAGQNALVRVTDGGGTANASSTYDLAIDNRDFTDLGTVTTTTPVSQTGIATAAAGKLFFVRTAAGNTVNVTITPTGFDASIQQLGRDENVLATVNLAGSGAPETLSSYVGSEGFLAFRVNGTTGTFDVAVSAAVVPPTTYATANGNVSFVDACNAPGGVELSQTPVGGFPVLGDESITDVQNMPFLFHLHGQSAYSYYVSANGFLSFEAPDNDAYFINGAIPDSTAPNGILAPDWDDLANIHICKLEQADRVIIEWRGTLFNSSTRVQFDAILHSNDTIEYVYGPNQDDDGHSATIGTESHDGTVGTQVSFNTASSIAPNTSIVFTPN